MPRRFLFKETEQFQAETKMMLAQVQAAKHTTGHGTIYGRNNEMVLIRFLQKYLPTRFTLSQGQVLDPDTKLGPESDIIIHDQTAYPPAMVFADGTKVIYVHSVYAVIQVKTTLRSDKLEQMLNNLSEIREREYRTKEVFGEWLALKGETCDANTLKDIDIYRFGFAYWSPMRRETIRRRVQDFEDSKPHKGRLSHGICILEFPDGLGDVLVVGREDEPGVWRFSKGPHALLEFLRTLYYAVCTQDRVEPGSLQKTMEVIQKYTPWGIPPIEL